MDLAVDWVDGLLNGVSLGESDEIVMASSLPFFAMNISSFVDLKIRRVK